MIAFFLIAPKTPITLYIFLAALGFTWLATVPPTSGLVGKLFGTKYLATLFGLTLLTHQIGRFLGAWLGGISIEFSGTYTWMWYADIALALAAAIVNLPIKEENPATMNCTPIVRHDLIIGGAVFLWLNLLQMINYKLLNVS
jgi:predicted MFS family arabinose efflux permease